VKAQVVQAEGAWTVARDCLEKAFAAVNDLDVPIFGWRVHVIAAEVFHGARDGKGAEQHRASAERLILGLANSFEEAEPLRESILRVAPVRRRLGGGGN
jgi:hypothetical protein